MTIYQRGQSRWLLFYAFALLLAACSSAQRGNLSFAVESLGNCDFDTAIAAARDVRSSGASDSDDALVSLLVEGHALDLSGNSGQALYQSFADKSPSVHSVASASEMATELFGELTVDCQAVDDSASQSYSSNNCEAWVGIIGLAQSGENTHALLEETRTIPLILPPDDSLTQWGFAIACDDANKPCAVHYALHAPTENWASTTNSEPSISREIETPPGGVVRPFGFDPGDYFGTYRLVVDLDGREVCDTTISVVE